jgi:hypothetical protein
MPFQRKKRASVPPVVMAGTTVLPGMRAPEARDSARMRGVSMVDSEPPRRRLGGVSMVTRSARSPMASFSMASTSSDVIPGSARMSTWISTRSGITFTLLPPCATLGENVVWVQAWASRASVALSMSRAAFQTRSGSTRAAVRSGSSSSAVM